MTAQEFRGFAEKHFRKNKVLGTERALLTKLDIPAPKMLQVEAEIDKIPILEQYNYVLIATG